MSNILNDIWSDWTIVEKIGSGAFGTVYSAKKEDGGHFYEAAIKVIHIPQDKSEIRDLQYQGRDYQSICGLYKELKENLRNEISVMETLRTANNIVSIDDYMEVPSEDGIGWTMYIRMEKLTSLIEFKNGKKMTLDDIVKLGRDMCNALVCCEKEKIIHRDIKPANVFVNKYGDYKLGDFGISRQLEKTQSVRSQKGTYQYMAPEVYHGESYNQTVDIYSLGIMLYQLLNDGRFPFSPMASQMPKAEDGEKALEERMQGKKLPAPSVLAVFEKTDMDLRGTDKSSLTELVDIILKACSYQTEDRYQNASEMAEELKKWVIKNEYERGTPVRKQEEPFESLGSTSIKTGNNKQPPNDAGNSVGGEGAEVSKQDEGTIGYIDIPRDKSNREMVKIENGEPEQPEKSEPITVQKGKKEPEKEKKEEKKDKKWFINFFLFFGVYFLIYIVCMGCELSYLGSIMTGDIIPFIQWPFLFLCTNILPTIYFVGLLVLQKGVMDKWLWCVTIAIAEICGTVVFIAFYRIGTNLMPANGENIELWLLIVQNLLIIGTFISTLTKKMKIIHSGH